MTPQKIIRSYLTIAGLYTLSASLIWGVNTLFLLDAGLDIFGVFIANSVFTASMAVFEIPTGVLADTRGRRASFLLSVAVVCIGTLAYVGVAAIGGGLLLFSLASVVLGLGYTFYSGAVEAWLVDALNETGYDGGLDKVFARGSFITGGAMLIGTVSGGLLGNLDLSAPFVGRAGLLVIVFGVAWFTMHDIGFAPRAVKLASLPGEMKAIAQASIQYGWQIRPVRLLMLVSLIHGAFLSWGFYAWQPYFLELLGREAVWVAGVVAALISISTMLGNALVEWLLRFCGKRTTLLLWASAGFGLAAIAVGLADSFWAAVPVFLVITFSIGVLMPVKQAYLHQVIPSEQRATVISFDSLVGSVGSVGGQSGLGYLSQVRSIASGYVTGGAGVLFALPVLLLLRRTGGKADLIIGQGGAQSACAAQGLPGVASVDTVARQPVEAAAD